MQLLLLIPACLVLVRLIYRSLRTQIQRSTFKKTRGCYDAPRLPQSERWLGIGRTLEAVRALKERRMLDMMKQRFEDAGSTHSCTVAGNKMIFTRDPENVKAVLATQFDDFETGWMRRRALAPFVKEAIILADGAKWHHQRTMLRPAFARRQFSSHEIFEKPTDNLIRSIPRDGSAVDLAPLFYELTLTNGTKLLFDETLSSLKPGFENTDEFVKAFQEVDRGIELRFRLGRLTSLIPRNRRFEQAIRTVHEYGDAFVHKALDYQQSQIQVSPAAKDDGSDGGGGGGRQQRYVFTQELSQEVQDPTELRDHLLSLLVVSSETTASILTTSFGILKDRKDLWAQMRDEILQMDGDVEPSYEQLKRLKHVEGFVNEVLRLYPPLPMYHRLASKDTTLPVGGGPDGKSKIFVPKNTFVSFNLHSMHRRKDLYGSDAEEFKPERWADLKSQNNWGYIPFSAGPRVCLGQQFALMEFTYTLFRLLREFKDIDSRGPAEFSESLMISYTNKHGARVAFTPA